MPVFAYDARDGDGRALRGTLEAATAAALANDLRTRGWLVLDLRPHVDGRVEPGRATRTPYRWFERAPRKLDVENGLRQLALMERSGLALLPALRSAATNAQRPSMSRVWDAVADRIEAGSTFTDGLAEHRKQFPPIVVEMVRAGEHSGSLDVALDRGADHLQRRRELRATFLQALFYPAIVVVLAVTVALYMVIQVVPVLEGFLQGGHKKLPWMTQALVDTSRVLRANGPHILVVLALLVALYFALDRYPPTRRTIDRALYELPLIGRLRVLSATATFSRSLGALIGNGIDIVHGLSLCEGILSRPMSAEAIARARERIVAGDHFAESIAGSVAFAPILPKMIDVGEKSGTLDRVLDDVASFHESELRAWIKRASAIIEPVVTLVIGALVGFVYIAFFLAMFAAAGAV